MISNVSKAPMVDILSGLVGAQIVINENGDYQSLKDGGIVSINDIQSAISVQHDIYVSGIIDAINLWVANAITAGFMSSALGSDFHYQSQIEDQINLSGLANSGGEWPFKCSADNGATWAYVNHTSAQLKDVVSAGIAFKLKALLQGEILKAQVRATASQAEVDAIVWPQ